jgi:hypothetical protein
MKTHKYILTIEFESDGPVTKHIDPLIQFENGLGYFVEGTQDSINNTFIYGTGNSKLVKVVEKKKVVK